MRHENVYPCGVMFQRKTENKWGQPTVCQDVKSPKEKKNNPEAVHWVRECWGKNGEVRKMIRKGFTEIATCEQRTCRRRGEANSAALWAKACPMP